MNPAKAEKLREGNWIGKRVLGGVRPEHVLVPGPEDKKVFEGTVNVFELLGSNAIVYVQTQAGKIVMNTQHVETYGHGDKIVLCVEKDRVHVFDPETERTVTN
jgi:multiple sugar transport system ATP-binding protein